MGSDEIFRRRLYPSRYLSNRECEFVFYNSGDAAASMHHFTVD